MYSLNDYFRVMQIEGLMTIQQVMQIERFSLNKVLCDAPEFLEDRFVIV